MTTPLTRSQAKTWTIGAQAGALICVLGAVAVGVVGLPEHEKGIALQQARDTGAPGGTNNANKPSGGESDPFRSSGVDMLGLSERLALLDNAPAIPKSDDDEENQPPEGNPEPPDGPGIDDITIVRRVKYIGFINSTETQHAFIRIDGKQRIVSVGEMAKSGDEQLPDLKVDRITPTRIFMSEGENRAEVRLASKSGSSVTMVSGDDIAVAVSEDNNNGSLLTADEEAYIESLSPRQQPSARRRLEREKRGLSPEPNRRPTPEPLVRIRGNAGENTPARVERRDD